MLGSKASISFVSQHCFKNATLKNETKNIAHLCDIALPCSTN